MNFLEEQPYAVINGAAGTGKTMIALEKARRHSENGERVLFLCYNRFLCDYCKANHAQSNVVYQTIDSFACTYCLTETADYQLLLEKLENDYYDKKFPFKHVIIDEGQDFGQERIEEAGIIDTLETIVLSEEVNGSFYLFYDKNQLIQGSRIPRYIADSDCKLSLYKNCRNTKKIAITSMRPLKSNKPPRMIDGCVDGDSPTVFVSTNEEKQKEYLDIVLKQLKNKGIQDVVILTCKTENTSVISSYSEGGRYKSNGSFYQFTTCRKYKGLEADAVVLIDVDKNVLIGDNNLIFYVGASRARFFLSIICHMNEEDCTEAVNTLKASNAKLKRPKKALAATLNALLQMLN